MTNDVVVSSVSSNTTCCSTESSFRDLDDVFLQTQTRIWVGEVLQTRLEEESNVADSLADGELLFQISREIWQMLLTKSNDLRWTKAYKYEPFASRRSSGRYTPYSNVDSFLKICKIMGLAGIDFFSPSDVVEKRNTRKVCMCIRALSKKARSKGLSVPDFDIVTAPLAMPTDMVDCIRRSLEISTWGSPNSACLGSKQKSKQELSNADSSGNYVSYFDDSDDTESNSVFPSDSSSTNYSCNTSPLVKNLLHSPCEDNGSANSKKIGITTKVRTINGKEAYSAENDTSSCGSNASKYFRSEFRSVDFDSDDNDDISEEVSSSAASVFGDFDSQLVAQDDFKCGFHKKCLNGHREGSAFDSNDRVCMKPHRSVGTQVVEQTFTDVVKDTENEESHELRKKDETIPDGISYEHLDQFDVKEGKGELKRPKKQRPIVKSLVGGTAALGLFLFLLHVRKNSRERTPTPKKQPHVKPNNNISEVPTRKMNEVYPAQKLGFF